MGMYGVAWGWRWIDHGDGQIGNELAFTYNGGDPLPSTSEPAASFTRRCRSRARDACAVSSCG